MFERRSFTVKDTGIPVRHITRPDESANMLIELSLVVLHTCGMSAPASAEPTKKFYVTKFIDDDGNACAIFTAVSALGDITPRSYLEIVLNEIPVRSSTCCKVNPRRSLIHRNPFNLPPPFRVLCLGILL